MAALPKLQSACVLVVMNVPTKRPRVEEGVSEAEGVDGHSRFMAAMVELNESDGTYERMKMIPNVVVRILTKHKFEEDVDRKLDFVESYIAGHFDRLSGFMKSEVISLMCCHHRFGGGNLLGYVCERGLRAFLGADKGWYLESGQIYA